MKRLSLLLMFFVVSLMYAQRFTGRILLEDRSGYFINQVFVTNLNTYQTVLSDFEGSFSIPAMEGDVIRFTSIVTERTDLRMDEKKLSTDKNFVQLKPVYHDIAEVVVGFKPSGNLRKDVTSLKKAEKSLEIAQMVGLPAPKGGEISPVEPLLGTGGGSVNLSLESIYDYLSGEREKKLRAHRYEKMANTVNQVKKYFGDEYFVNLGVPENLVENFLQFIYYSDNISIYTENNQFEAVKPYIEKYLPIYLKRLKNSRLADNYLENQISQTE